MFLDNSSVKKQIKFNIDTETSSQRLDKFLLSKFNKTTNSLIQKLIRTKKITVNGKKVKHSYLLSVGDIISLPNDLKNNFNAGDKKNKTIYHNRYNDKVTQIVNLIIYKDDNLIIINKPSGIAVQGGSKVGFNITLAFHKLRFGLQNDPFIVHRIDKDTSGVLVLARNKQAARHISSLFQNNQISKTYTCLVYPFDLSRYKNIGFNGTISTLLMKNRLSNMEKMVTSSEGKQAITNYKVLNYNDDIGYIELNPITGRTHQIRVHMAEYLNNPIIGDFKYGANSLREKKINYRKMYLHAKSISFISIDGKKIFIKADYDNIFSEALKLLSFNSEN